jgi:hypothetical protein
MMIINSLRSLNKKQRVSELAAASYAHTSIVNLKLWVELLVEYRDLRALSDPISLDQSLVEH